MGWHTTLNEANGDEVYSLNLAPGEMKELFVNLDIPMSASLGSSTTTTLTICVGSSSDALCEDINVNLTSTSITIQKFIQEPCQMYLSVGMLRELYSDEIFHGT